MVRSVDTVLADVIQQPHAAATLGPLLCPWSAQYWQAQANMLYEAEAFADRWFERRQTATKTALKAVENIANGASDPSDALKIISDWQRYSAERVIVDFQDWVELCFRCTGNVSQPRT